jgi:ATP-binding cassette subfamily B (MDR/TAP) protein 1
MGQLVAEETAKRRELQDAQVEEGLNQHEAGGDYDDGEMVLQQKRLSRVAATTKKKKDQLMKKLHKKENRKTVPYYMLYKYADWIDAVLMLVGSLAAVVNGLILPAMFLIQTKVINALGTLQSQPNQLYSRISKVSMHEQM